MANPGETSVMSNYDQQLQSMMEDKNLDSGYWPKRE